MATAIDFHKGPLVMGVVNVTPDSFSDGGDFLDSDLAVKHALEMVQSGADILDIGGESTRPGADPVSPEEEQRRILPVIEKLKESGCKIPISVDTRHAETMQKLIEAGVDIINDISALTHDINSLSVASKAQIPVMLMHSKGLPKTMQDKPDYDDVVREVYDYLSERKRACIYAGIDPKNIILDPGIGFGKRLEDNLNLIKHIDKFHELNCPILLGTSRKSFIEKICSDTPPEKRLSGSLSSLLFALDKGVQIFRVHDVAETVQAIKVWQAIKSGV